MPTTNGRSERTVSWTYFLALFVLLSTANAVRGQQSAPAGPQPSSAGAPGAASSDPPKNDRIFGVIPNYRTVEDPSRGIVPLTAKQKFGLAMDDSFDPYAYPVAGIFAAIAQAQNSPRSWGQGWGAFAKRFGAQFVDQTDENMMTEAVVPSLLKQDPRYFRMGQGGFLTRTGYAVSRIWVTRTDAGHKTFNISEIGGAGIAATISNTYYPPDSRSASQTLSRWGIFVGEDTLFNVLKEFWPDMRQRIFRK